MSKHPSMYHQRKHVEYSAENRREVLAWYFGVEIELIQDLATITHNGGRKELCIARGIDPHIFRTMVDYTRYREAQSIDHCMGQLGHRIEGMQVLDFGCLVADYGIYFARLGAEVTVYDVASVVRFAAHRFQIEGLRCRQKIVPLPWEGLTAGMELVIFGEVLEHLADPLSAIGACVGNGVKYIFTSCYPYGEESYFAAPGHKKSAQLQQEDCIALLESRYTPSMLLRKARLWRRN